MTYNQIRCVHSWFLIWFSTILMLNPIFADDSERYQSRLNRIVEVQRHAKHIHPFLEELYPIAIVAQDHFHIFDFDSTINGYLFIKKAPLPYPLPENIAASYPLQEYNARPSCIIGEEIFEESDYFVTVLHEFMHCAQMGAGEQDIKSSLGIYKNAMATNDYMWEIAHPFPYSDSVFVNNYGAFLSAVEQNDTVQILRSRARLKNSLSLYDYEYMCWQEWKEGFARRIENEIRQTYNLIINQAGKAAPYERIIFYYGGEQFIRYLESKNSTIIRFPADLFTLIQSPEEIQ